MQKKNKPASLPPMPMPPFSHFQPLSPLSVPNLEQALVKVVDRHLVFWTVAWNMNIFCRFFRENVGKRSLRLTWDLMVETNLVIEAMFSRKIRRMKNFLKDFIIVVFLQWQRRVDFKVKPWKRWIDYENEKDFWTKNFVKLTQMLKISSKILHF